MSNSDITAFQEATQFAFKGNYMQYSRLLSVTLILFFSTVAMADILTVKIDNGTVFRYYYSCIRKARAKLKSDVKTYCALQGKSSYKILDEKATYGRDPFVILEKDQATSCEVTWIFNCADSCSIQ